jgi:hypothetical protein
MFFPCPLQLLALLGRLTEREDMIRDDRQREPLFAVLVIVFRFECRGTLRQFARVANFDWSN